MGDMAEEYRAWDAMKKEEKQRRNSANIEIIKTCNLPYKIGAGGTVLFKTTQGTICFYPTTNVIQHKQKIIYGAAMRAIAYVRKINEGK